MEASNARIFLALTVIALLASVGIYSSTLVGGDEGRFVQDALRISRGEVPIADYGTRAPILSWFVYASSQLFGPSLLAFRLPVILFSALTSGFLFLLGALLVSRKTAFISALLFSLTPITLWNNVVIKTEALTVLFVVISAYFLIRGLQESQKLYFFLSGIPLGVAYIERQSVVAFMLTAALMVATDVWEKKSKMLNYFTQRGFLLIGGVIVGFLPVFLYISFHNFSAAYHMWFTSDLREIVLSTKDASANASSGVVSDFWRAWILTFVETLAVQAGLLFSALGFFIMCVLEGVFRKRKQIGFLFSTIFAVLFFGAFFMHAGLIIYRGTFRPQVFLTLALDVVLLGGFFLAARYYSGRLQFLFKIQDQITQLIIFWMVGLFVAYSFFTPGYVREWVPPLCLIAAIFMTTFQWRELNVKIRVFFVSTIIIFWVVGFAWFQDPKTGGWWWTQKTVNNIAEYLNTHTTPGQKIFAANPLPVMMAERRTVADITSYAMVFAENADDHYSSFPSPHEMLAMLQSDPPRYALIDRRMQAHFFDQYKFFEDFVRNNYE